MTELVIDASIAIPLLLNLPNSTKAERAVAHADRLIAPDLIVHEFANTIWKLTRAGTIAPDIASRAIDGLDNLLSAVIDGRSLIHDAFQRAIRLEHSVYDCSYFALAILRGIPLLTADKQFAGRLNKAGYATAVRLLPT